MMRLRSVVLALACAGVPVAASAATETHMMAQQRAVFDLVGGKTDLRAACPGGTPVQVEIRHTARDVAAALFSGWWYTPVHLRVTCTTP